tara:strand:- start:246 stop:3551 length:3306 start_codon:yes stop_codon:yes gene_type:complete
MISEKELENLKIKPIAKKKEDINIELNSQGSNYIIDETKEKKINKLDFLSKIKKNVQIVNKTKEKDIYKVKKDEEKEKDKKKEEIKSQTKKTEKITNIIKTLEKIVIKNLETNKLLSTERQTPKPKINYIEIPKSLKIGRSLYINRVPKKEPNILIKAPSYYLENREIFINFINSLFEPYKLELMEEEKKMNEDTSINCSSKKSDDFSLLIHQKIVRDYINIYTPYRGLLLYHGLGSGKTCTSIAIAEGLKNDKSIIVMTPASLRNNYIEELKKCGDYLYKKNQYWEFVNTKKNPDLIPYLRSILGLSDEYIAKNGGAWFVNVKKESNYNNLTTEQQVNLNNQINNMINNKYEFINYNGLRESHLQALSENYTKNPFTNKVVIIDEAHNLVSRIVNKLKNSKSIAMKLYEYLLNSENTKIILLSGTPIINYPNEVGVMFNILRGSIKTYDLKLNSKSKKVISKENLTKIFEKNELYTIDYMTFNSSSMTMTVTQNPFNFVNTKENKNKVYFNDKIDSSSQKFISNIKDILKTENIEINNDILVNNYKCLPDNYDEFRSYFIDENNNMKNTNMLKMRILGLVSYFKSPQEKLMPKYDENLDFYIIDVPMSDFQFSVYEEARIQERKLEEYNKKKSSKKQKEDLFSDTVSTYRIFSRAFCNFVFPRPHIKRPMPIDGQTIENALDKDAMNDSIIDNTNIEEKMKSVEYDLEDVDKSIKDKATNHDSSYENRINEALMQLDKYASKFLVKSQLSIYSPKFLSILENISDPEHVGNHLLYTQFRTLEGIGIFKLVLNNNGYSEFKIRKKEDGKYFIDIKDEDKGKPMYALHTGTENNEEKEIIKNIFNSNWKLVPSNLIESLNDIAENNNLGDIIKLLMITSSGAEGITLKNVRYVHIMEPYWHYVRIEQVIGRAKRICSHYELPKELQNIKVFLYVMNFTTTQLESDTSIELRLKDKGKIDKTKIVTSDQLLYEIASIKKNINKNILDNIKQSAIDCNVHINNSSCFSISNPNNNNYVTVPNIANQDNDEMMNMNKKKIMIKLKEVTVNDVIYIYDPDEKKYEINNHYKVYDYDTYKKNKELLEVARLIKDESSGFKFVKLADI